MSRLRISAVASATTIISGTWTSAKNSVFHRPVQNE
jgi:hypothetical protein